METISIRLPKKMKQQLQAQAKKMRMTPSELIREKILETIVKDFELWDFERLEAEIEALERKRMRVENKIRFKRARKGDVVRDKDGKVILPSKLIIVSPTESELAEADRLEKQLKEEILPKLFELTQQYKSLKKQRDSIEVVL